jgi:predicted phage-related endonuclease
MNIIVLTCEQRTPEWYAARLGRLTASVAKDMLAMNKSGGESASRRDLRTSLVLERLTGKGQGSDYVNADMQRGIDKEPEARLAYEALTGTLVDQVGFVQAVDLMVGCSPDGLIGDDGGIDCKCPRSANHLAFLNAKSLPADYLPQVLHTLWVTGRQWWDVASFDDRFPEGLQLRVIRTERDEKAIAEYAAKAQAFLGEVETELAAMRTMQNVGAVLREAVA